MANVQYIGARYVPLIFKNPDDHSNNWKSGVSYEALTVVTYLDDSYTSKIPVPASVGNPADNSTYWVKTSNFNAALSSLQSQVNDLDDEVNEVISATFLHNKKIVAYGDSSIYRGAGESSYLNYVADAVNATLTNRAIPGTDIVNTTNLINSSSDLTDFDVIFIGHGIAEFNGNKTYDYMRTAINNLINAIRGKSFRITIIYALPYFIYKDFNDGFEGVENWKGVDMQAFNEWCMEILNELSIPHINFYTRSTCNYVTYQNKLLDDSGGVFVHPNEDFKKELASIVLNGPDDYKFKPLVPMLNNVDFATARHRVSLAEMASAANLNEGYALKVLNGETIISTTKLFNRGRYILHGIAQGTVKFTIGANNYYFDSNFDLEFTRSYGAEQLKISAESGDVILSNFQLYYLNKYDDCDRSPFKQYILPTFAPSAGISQPIVLKTFIDGNNLCIDSFALAVSDNTQLTAGETIYNMADNFDFGNIPQFLLGISTSGNILLLTCRNNKITLPTPLAVPANDTYFIQPLTFTPMTQYYH